MLQVDCISKSFGGVQALEDVSFQVDEGCVTALVGPNGAGKSTLFNIVAGTYPPTRGTIRMAGRELNGMSAWQRVQLGIGRTFQNVLLFDNMTVIENVMVGRHSRTHSGILAAAFRLRSMRTEEERIYLDAMRYLNLVGLGMHAGERAGSLPFGKQRLLAVARSLAAEPRLLMLDEPAAGLNALEKADLADLIRRLQELGITVLLVEHDMDLVMQLAERVIVLYHGRKLVEGTAVQVRSDRRVLAAYLGEGAA